MIYQRGHLARPLDAILGNASRLACLRALARAKGPLSGRQVARLGGINHQAAALALRDLETAGVAVRRPAARSIQWELDREHFLVDKALGALFEAEVRHADAIVAAIKDGLARKASGVVVVGAAACGKLHAGAPLELVVLCEVGRRRALNDALRALAADLRGRFGLELRVATLARAQAPSRLDLLDGWQLLPTEGPPRVFSAGF